MTLRSPTKRTVLVIAASVALMLTVLVFALQQRHDSLVELLSSAQSGDTIELAPGTYQGPVVIDRPVHLVGGPGVLLTSTRDEPVLLITKTSGVTIESITIDGGRNGIEVRDSVQVQLNDITIRNADWHGILIDDSEVDINGCDLSGFANPMAQGIEYRNADGRGHSTVRGCHIHGPVFEGLVAHVSNVTFANNTVTGATERGISVTEMSTGWIDQNTVTDSAGAAYFCGDMSVCNLTGNDAMGIVGNADGRRSGAGHAVVVHYHSHAFIDGLTTDDLLGDPVLVMFDSHLSDEPLE